MTGPLRPRCPNCGSPNAAGQLFCGRCGVDLRTPGDEWERPTSAYVAPATDWQQQAGSAPRSGTGHRLLKGALGLWTIAYPVISCSPLFTTGADTGGAAAAGGLVSLVVGATLFGPWIVGVIVLGILVLLTR